MHRCRPEISPQVGPRLPGQHDNGGRTHSTPARAWLTYSLAGWLAGWRAGGRAGGRAARGDWRDALCKLVFIVHEYNRQVTYGLYKSSSSSSSKKKKKKEAATTLWAWH